MNEGTASGSLRFTRQSCHMHSSANVRCLCKHTTMQGKGPLQIWLEPLLHCRHKFFNTNNLWVNLPALKKTLDANNGVLKLPLIKNKKTVNPRDSDTPAVFQLETAMGSAIECFDDAGAVVVRRDRFAPVKTCNDLFALRSDVYEVCSLAYH